MKDTITLAELRQTKLYRREQTRPLREFLMENIDVLKLADEVEMWGKDLLALNMKGGIPVIEGAKMLRQQQAEIEALKLQLHTTLTNRNIEKPAVEDVMEKYCTCYKLGYSPLNDYASVKAK
jgi:hypothetical protein